MGSKLAVCTWLYTLYTPSYGRYIFGDGKGCLLILVTLRPPRLQQLGGGGSSNSVYAVLSWHAGCIYLFIVFLVFGEARWQVPMGQLRNFIFIISVHQTWDKGLIVFPDRVLRTLTSIQIPAADFND